MSLTITKGLQSEIYVPITPPAVWTPVKKELKDMSIDLATAAGVHCKSQERFNLAGDSTWRNLSMKQDLRLNRCSKKRMWTQLS